MFSKLIRYSAKLEWKIRITYGINRVYILKTVSFLNPCLIFQTLYWFLIFYALSFVSLNYCINAVMINWVAYNFPVLCETNYCNKLLNSMPLSEQFVANISIFATDDFNVNPTLELTDRWLPFSITILHLHENIKIWKQCHYCSSNMNCQNGKVSYQISA